MKKVLIMMAGLFLLACNNEKAKETESKVKYRDLSLEMLNGKVQSYEESPYKVDASGKPAEMDSCCIDLTEYDENGNAVKYVSKDSKGTVKNESVYTRLENGLWVGSVDTKEGGKPSGSMKVAVNDKGEYTIAQTFDSTGKPDKYYTTASQNEYGQVSSWKEYDKDSVFHQEWEAKYDKSLLVSSNMKDSVGKSKNNYAAKYNDKGEIIESSNTNITKDSTTVKTKKFTYESHDDQGNWTQRTEWDDKGKAVKAIKRTYVYKKAE
jgi:hypothetical protein